MKKKENPPKPEKKSLFGFSKPKPKPKPIRTGLFRSLFVLPPSLDVQVHLVQLV